jgi:hypothetical protein
MAKPAGSNPSSNTRTRFVVLRDIALILFGLLLDRTVSYKFPTFVPILPYAWLIVAVWLTREVLAKTPLRTVLIRAYSRYGVKHRVLSFLVIFTLGGLLLYAYWFGINRVLDGRPPPSDNESTFVENEPTFAEDIDKVKITVGGNDAIYLVSDLEKTPRPWMGLRLPLLIYVKDKKPYVDATVSTGLLVPIELKANKLVGYPPGWDYNSNDRAIEIVNDKQLPVFQLIYNRPNHIVINGIFLVRDTPNGPPNIYVANEAGITINPTSPDSLRRVFKYPSWQHRGEYETR